MNDQLTGLGASHPANRLLTVERIIRIIKELQSSIQCQNGGEMANVIADGIKGLEELLVSRKTASGPIGHDELDHLIWGLERYGLYPRQLAALIELRELRKIMLQKTGQDN